jgi:hypothetical protein
VTVTGEVTAGARVPLSTKGDRLLDVVARRHLAGHRHGGAGRLDDGDDDLRLDRLAGELLSRGGTTATVPLTAVVSNPRENIFLRPGDTLTLAGRRKMFSRGLETTAVSGTVAVVPPRDSRTKVSETAASRPRSSRSSPARRSSRRSSSPSSSRPAPP